MLVDDGTADRGRRRRVVGRRRPGRGRASRPRSARCCRLGSSGWRPRSGRSPSGPASSAGCSSRRPSPSSRPMPSGPSVGRSLLALVRKELIRPGALRSCRAGDAFKFRHILIRDAAYEALPKSERAILHERFADWLERTVGERLAEYEEIVGYHLEQAHRYRTELGETGDAWPPWPAGPARTWRPRVAAHSTAATWRPRSRSCRRRRPSSRSDRSSGCDCMPDLGFALFSLGRIPDAERLLGAVRRGRRRGRDAARSSCGDSRARRSGSCRSACT